MEAPMGFLGGTSLTSLPSAVRQIPATLVPVVAQTITTYQLVSIQRLHIRFPMWCNARAQDQIPLFGCRAANTEYVEDRRGQHQW